MNSVAQHEIQASGFRALGVSRRNSGRSAWLFAIALFGYPIVGNLIAILRVDSRELSIPFRIVVILFSLWVIATTPRLRVDRWRQLMLVIWFLYILRLLHDWFFTDLEGADFALQYFVASSVFPAVALMKARAFQPRRFAVIGFWVASVGACTSILSLMLGGADVGDVAVSTGRLSVTALDPVSLGYEATSAIICGLMMWRRASLTAKAFLGAVFLVLAWCVVLTGSKGPAFALMLCGALWGFRNGQTWKFAIVVVPLLAAVLSSEGNPLVRRLSSSDNDESTGGRLIVLNDSLNQIAGSPIIGSAFVEYNSGIYPHNVFIEAALALGIPLALLFLALMLFASRSAWRTLKSDHALLGLLFFQALFAATTSGSLFGALSLWIIVAMLPASKSALRSSQRKSLLLQ